MKYFIFTILITLCIQTAAHEGHDHGAATFQPPKGGILKTALFGHFELVKKKDLISIFLYNKEGKLQPTTGLSLKAELELPRKKSTPVELTDKNTHWEAQIQSQGTHRFTLKITIDNGKEKDYVTFTVENK